MPATLGVVRPGQYVDSVSLLQVTAEVLGLAGVLDAALVMATELNRALLHESDLLVDQARTAGANDLVIAVRASDEATATGAIEHAERLLVGRRAAASSPAERLAPRSLRSAHRAAPEASLAVISVPGAFAANEARQALADGLHVFLFSDNVPIEDEIELKRSARERGLLVMGPDCGTAILNGVGLGFANVVRQGSIGVVGASGTGIQEVSSLVHQVGQGISHAIGTGSRDLHASIGGITTLQALELLRTDPRTETIVLVSKPPDAEVARAVLRALASTGKRAIAYLQGTLVDAPEGIQLAGSLEQAARLGADPGERAVWAGSARRLGVRGPEAPVDPHLSGVRGQNPGTPVSREAGAGATGQRAQGHRRHVRGLFCGGTLCQEAALVLAGCPGCALIDFGDDQFTRGRAHPMIDPTLRNHAILEAGRDPSVGVLLLDFILGLAAHPDPVGAAAPALAQAIDAARHDGRELSMFAHVVGTDRDPQQLAKQVASLESLGVHVLDSNSQAALAARRVAA